ncbi:MAG: sugar ABC transporter permease [Lachnospiraceae bacterium]|nr:sugar ABC transporter permease [Lachnospiraceae bacterium]
MKKRSEWRTALRRDWQLYVFLLIPITYILIFAYAPMGGIVMAFQDYSARKGILGSDWVGLDNFRRFFESYNSRRAITNTIVLSLYTIVAGFPIPICFALMLNSLRREKFKKVTQTIVNMPHFISVTVMVGILMQIFNPRTGLYGAIGEWITGNYPGDILGSAAAFRHLYVWSGIWQNFGWNSVIYTAALSSVDPTYHEAAMLDGATRLQRVRHVDIPAILPTVVTMLILRMGSVMSIGFEKVYLMQNGLNMATSDIISTYVYQVSLAADGISDFSYATAIGLFNNVIEFILITIVNKISKKVSETSLW